mgnify:CR=1 FL=1
MRRSFALPDLASRLRAAPAVAIREPDDILLGSILVKMFNDRQLRVGQDVINYIVSHMERSFEEARRIVEESDKMALIQKKNVSVVLIKELFSQ